MLTSIEGFEEILARSSFNVQPKECGAVVSVFDCVRSCAKCNLVREEKGMRFNIYYASKIF